MDRQGPASIRRAARVATNVVAGLRGMPADLFAAQVLQLFHQKMAAADAVPCAYLKDSVCFRHTVRSIPLKPEVDAAAPCFGRGAA